VSNTQYDIIFVADFFTNEVPNGGGEVCNEELINLLRKDNSVLKLHSYKLSDSFLKAHPDSLYILSGFLLAPKESLSSLENMKYVIYEHDHKYLLNRNPAAFKEYVSPKENIVFESLYQNANLVVCQSKLHQEIISKNLPNLSNLYNAGCSLWGEQIEKFNQASKDNQQRKSRTAILRSNQTNKGQDLAQEYCHNSGIQYDLVSARNSVELYKVLSGYETLVFLPRTPETFSRVFLEAKLAGCKVITNNLIGALSEKYDWSSRESILDKLKQKEAELVEAISSLFTSSKDTQPRKKEVTTKKQPKISIITSVFKGEDYIEKFLAEMTKQQNFSECEMILVDCNKQPGFEKEVIERYQKHFSNLRYHHLEKDPGVYGAWNYGIKNSKGKYITNANLDDFRSYEQLKVLSEMLDKNKDIDLVYHPFIQTDKQEDTFYTTLYRKTYESYDFSPKMMIKCLPGCMPLWRRSLHDKNGYFEEKYKHAGDWEFWLRCVQSGSKFMRNKKVMGCYYFNPEGLSTAVSNNQTKHAEEIEVFNKYREVINGKSN